MCHLRQKKHSPAFIALMNTYLPGWQATRKQLNEFVMDAYDA
ncbi:MAG: M48 family metallopeptidase [Kiritimatiellaeota bacterium]|nr:M48 family metallopeptidase [Kiritimatiellota bacterium]